MHDPTLHQTQCIIPIDNFLFNLGESAAVQLANYTQNVNEIFHIVVSEAITTGECYSQKLTFERFCALTGTYIPNAPVGFQQHMYKVFKILYDELCPTMFYHLAQNVQPALAAAGIPDTANQAEIYVLPAIKHAQYADNQVTLWFEHIVQW